MPLTLSALILHFAMLDGSAGFAVSNEVFIGASDEENTLYACSVAGGPPLNKALELNNQKPESWFHASVKNNGKVREADIESATQSGDVIYWITSHARDAGKPATVGKAATEGKPANEGKPEELPENKPERQRLFATKLVPGSPTSLVPHGAVAYANLLTDITHEPLFTDYGLELAATKAPKVEGGFNIESLCAEPNGTRLFIGLRNPIPKGRALLLPLKNAPELIAGTATKASFDKAIELDLRGLGLRDMIWWPEQKCYLLIGGHYDEHLNDNKAPNPKPNPNPKPKPKLFIWDGEPSHPPTPQTVDVTQLNPECLIHFPNGRVLILSDDGAMKDSTDKTQKDEPDQKLHSFRSAWIEGTPDGK